MKNGTYKITDNTSLTNTKEKNYKNLSRQKELRQQKTGINLIFNIYKISKISTT